MQANLLPQDDNWKHRHRNGINPWDQTTPYPEFGPSIDTPSPGHRRLCPLAHPSSNSTALNPTQQDTPALQTQPGNSHPGVEMPYLPPPKSLVKRVKGKCLSSTLRAFKDKLQTETASKQFSQVHYGDPHHRGHEKLPGVGSPAPTEDHMTTRTSYMPLFSERLNLCKPKVNSIKWEPNTTSLLNKGKHTGQSSCLKASSRSTYDNRTQNSQM
uniref:uncharacterized protein LOC118529163 isoform X1 n=1 Tax=Halichoerus grypus TaxID=9711 RepID=UPI0016593DC2|nr:uncharacterized protein LOC118529163 isoform X1 [Halichoerus grypus]